MTDLNHLFDQNRAWAAAAEEDDPEFFSRLATQQNPEYLWIGCSDSRVAANQIVNLPPGEIFVHRNIANVVTHTDLNCLSVIQYAVEVLKVKHMIVCGHYGCGGIQAAMENKDYGLLNNWLKHIKDVDHLHTQKLENLDSQTKLDLLCELNVMEQRKNLCNTSTVQNAWNNGADLTIHGWIYNIANGILKPLSEPITSHSTNHP